MNSCVRGLAAIAAVITLLITVTPAPAKRTMQAAPNCRGLADLPRPADLHSTLPQLYAWGQFDCDAPARLAVQICAIRYTPTGLILDDKVVWCAHRIVKIPAGRTTFVRTPLHRCSPGKEYASYIRIIGQPWNRGAAWRCRSL